MRIVSERPAAPAVWYVGEGRAEIRPETDASPAPGEVQVRALYGAISRGTERLVFFGRVPESEYQRMRAPFMGGTFPFPAKYGYSTVGRVENGPRELVGRTVFALYPHQDLFALPAEPVTPAPDRAPPRRPLLPATTQTALHPPPAPRPG